MSSNIEGKGVVIPGASSALGEVPRGFYLRTAQSSRSIRFRPARQEL